MIRGAIFDVDGTLFDSMGAWHNAGYNYLKNQGVNADRSIGNVFFSMTMDEVVEYIQKNFHVPGDKEDVAKGIHDQVEDYYRDRVELKPGAMNLLNTLRTKGIPCTIATSTDRYLIEMGLDKVGIGGYFVGIFTTTEVGKGKSSPDIFRQAMHLMGTEAKDTWLFEDGLYSMNTAKAYGMSVVGVYDKVSHEDQGTIKEVADIYVETLEDLRVEDLQRWVR